MTQDAFDGHARGALQGDPPNALKVMKNSLYGVLQRPLRIGVDLDGTLVHEHPDRSMYRRGNDWSRLAYLARRPIQPALYWTQEILAQGHDVHIVTGRGEWLRDVTQDTLDRLGLGHLPLHMWQEHPAIAHATGAPWRTGRPEAWTVEESVRQKTETLRRIGAHIMVGDRDDIDRAAAQGAGCLYVPVRSIMRVRIPPSMLAVV